jgi:hypothetical protein
VLPDTSGPHRKPETPDSQCQRTENATAIAKALGIGRASVYRVLETGH